MAGERRWLLATRISAAIVVVLFAVLFATGLYLITHYRPAEAGFTVRGVHRVAATLFLLAVAALAITSIGLFIVRRRLGPIAFSVLGWAFAFFASFSGFIIAWDQLFLYTVTVGNDVRGYSKILDGHTVKSVVVGSTEASAATISRWFWVHTLVTPLLIIVTFVVLWRAVRRTAQPGTAIPEP